MDALSSISVISSFAPFAYARQLQIDKRNFILILYLFIAGAFSMTEVLLYLSGIEEHYWLYHIYVPFEIVFLSVIILSLYELNPQDIIKYIKISSSVALAAVILDIICCNVRELDKMIMTFQCFYILFTIGSILFTYKEEIDFSLKDYRTYILSGVAVYHFMNVLTYPEYHMESNIISNAFLLIALIMSEESTIESINRIQKFIREVYNRYRNRLQWLR